MEDDHTYTTFCGDRMIVSGGLRTMILDTKEWLDRGGAEPVRIFDDATGAEIDFDFRGTGENVLDRLAHHPLFADAAAKAPPRRSGPGRPRLGVVSREVSLLPRHWQWLDNQPGSASAALRRLIEAASKQGRGAERARRARDAAWRFMSAMAGDLPGFEEASRALYAGDRGRLAELATGWPADIRDHLARLVERQARFERDAAREQPAGRGER